jgi:hypothetical protein
VEIAAYAAAAVIVVTLAIAWLSAQSRRSDVFADVVMFERARRALARDVAPERAGDHALDERRSA